MEFINKGFFLWPLMIGGKEYKVYITKTDLCQLRDPYVHPHHLFLYPTSSLVEMDLEVKLQPLNSDEEPKNIIDVKTGNDIGHILLETLRKDQKLRVSIENSQDYISWKTSRDNGCYERYRKELKEEDMEKFQK